MMPARLKMKYIGNDMAGAWAVREGNRKAAGNTRASVSMARPSIGGTPTTLRTRPIKAERAGTENCDPGEFAGPPGEIANANRSDDHGEPLHRAEVLPHKDHAQDNAEERIDEVTETGLMSLEMAMA